MSWGGVGSVPPNIDPTPASGRSGGVIEPADFCGADPIHGAPFGAEVLGADRLWMVWTFTTEPDTCTDRLDGKPEMLGDLFGSPPSGRGHAALPLVREPRTTMGTKRDSTGQSRAFAIRFAVSGFVVVR